MSINHVVVSGNLTRDPELRATAAGTQVLRLGLAVNDRARNPQTNEWEDRPNFVDCIVFGARAEALAGHLAKGMKVVVDGRLRWSSWQSKDGSRRSKLEVVVSDLDFMSPRPSSAAPREAMRREAPEAAEQPMTVQEFADEYGAVPVDDPARLYDRDVSF